MEGYYVLQTKIYISIFSFLSYNQIYCTMKWRWCEFRLQSKFILSYWVSFIHYTTWTDTKNTKVVPHLCKTIILLTRWAEPALSQPECYFSVLVAEPAVDFAGKMWPGKEHSSYYIHCITFIVKETKTIQLSDSW